MSPTLRFTESPTLNPMSKAKILNAVLNRTSEDAQQHFRASHISISMDNVIRRRIDALYKVEIQVMDDLYQIKFS